MHYHLQDTGGIVPMSGEIHKSWKCSHIRLILKKGSIKNQQDSYWPIAATLALYKLFCHIMWRRMGICAEGVLGELRNGFWQGHCLEDNLSVVTQAIEIVAKEERDLLVLAFLDISRAYDLVDLYLLWTLLKEQAMSANLQQILEALYKNNEAVVHWEDERTQSIRIPKGLCQGCPLFPLLFMLFVAGMVKKLVECDIGLDFSYWDQGTVCPRCLPALFYADDIMLLADNAKKPAAVVGHVLEGGTNPQPTLQLC